MAGVYISWPFCGQKCTYCNFASGVQPRQLEAQYLEALLKEVGAHKWAWTPRTVYMGGGTPSAIEPEILGGILGAVPGTPWLEATIEAAPGSLTRGRIEGWVRAGLNRVSLGVQSFVRQELARTGRKHTAETVWNDVELLRAGGLTNISVDLIAGLPGQTEASFRESLAAAIALETPHVSVYMLEVDEDSRLGAEILLGGKRYGAPDVPSEDAIAAFYELAVEELAKAGIRRYEISNFAQPGMESRHNLKYWRREPYAGFGADAHSFDGERRWRNSESAREYAEAGLIGTGTVRRQEPADREEERFFLGLRLSEGVDAGADDWRRFGSVFERFLQAGVMERSGERLRLTARGVMVSNEVFQEFLSR